MTMRIERIPGGKANLLYLPESFSNRTEAVPRRILIRIGAWRSEVEVRIHNELPDHAIGLSSEMKLPFELPDRLPYEAALHGRELHIGPVIAFLAFTNKNEMTPAALAEYQSCFGSGLNRGGLVYICAADGIHRSDKTIEGCFYDSSAKEENAPWKYGVFPYPDVVYRTAEVTTPQYDELIAEFGHHMFNTRLWNRWELWQYLSPYPPFREHLLYTEPLRHMRNLDDMLALYGSVYVKPADRRKAGPFFKVDPSNGGYRFIDSSAMETCFDSKQEASEFLHGLLSSEEYIVQQAVPATGHANRCMDFRVLMQKDGSKHWSCSGMIARIGGAAGIAAGLNRSRIALTGQQALRTGFSLNERDIFLKEQEMTDLCISACKILDRCAGHYAELGIDLIVDENVKVWLAEIGDLRSHKWPLSSINDRQTVFKVAATPFEYARALAGFG